MLGKLNGNWQTGRCSSRLVGAVPNGELDKLRLDGRDGAATAQSVMRDPRSHFVGDDRSFNSIVRAAVGWVGVTMQPTDDFASLANKLGVARSLLIQSDRVAAMTGVEVIDMIDIALMLYRIGQDKRYSQIVQFLRIDDGATTDVVFTTVIKGAANSIKGYVYDSGATLHVTPSAIPGSVGGVGIEVTTADGSTQRGDRVGAIGTLSGIHIVPDFERELLSAGKLIDATAGGAHVITSGGVYEIAPGEMDQISAVLARAPIATRSDDTGGLYICNKKAFGMSVSTPENPATVFHEAAGHVSRDYMPWLLKNPSQVDGKLPYTQKDVVEMLPCFGCSAGMFKRGSFTGSWDSINSSSDAICFTDTFGPTKTAAIGGYHHAQLFVTRRSRTSGVVLMKRAADAPNAVAKFFETSGMKYRSIPTVMYMDNASENIGPAMRTVLSDAGCRAEYCAPHGGDNNIAEVYIGIVTRGARALLAQAGLDTKFWGLAWLHFNHLRNMLPCKYNYKRMSSFQIEFGKPPDVTKLIPFGAIGLVQLPHDSRQHAREEKMASAVRKCVFVGYSDQHHGAFKCYFPDNNRVLIRRDVRWQSNAKPMRGPGDAAFRDFREHVELAVGSGELPSSEFAAAEGSF